MEKNLKKYRKFNLNKLVAFDTENNEKAECTLASFFDGKTFTIFKDDIFQKSLNYIEKNRGKYFVGLNVLYDLINIFGARNIVDNFKLFFGKTAFIFAKDELKNTYFDLFWLMPFSLKQIGKIIGLEKLETDNFENVEYNLRDTEITYNATKQFIEYLNNNRWQFAFTLASISLKIFRRYYQQDNFVEYETPLVDLLKKAYFGGRTENYVKGEVYENINVYDVNSLYPFVMNSCVYPNPNEIRASKKIEYFGIYKVKVKIRKDVEFPLLPYRSDKLIFPVGRFETWCTGAEILAAGEQIENIEILQGFIFAKGKKYFDRFTNDLYTMRKANENKFENKVLKLVMNSLYGKFAQGRERTIWDGEKFTIEMQDEYPENNIIPFSIFTTAFARIHMYNLFQQIQAKGGKIYYTDTDSIHTNIKMPTSTRLGALKLEGQFNYANYLAPKFYLLDGAKGEIVKGKGIPRDLQKEFIENLKVTYRKPIKLKESIKRNLKANLWVEITKQFRNTSDKRNFFENGSFPLEL